MKKYIAYAALPLAIAVASVPADAKGCIKGAIVGGIAGHAAGHHAVIGAVTGCVIGHHLAKQRQQAAHHPAAGQSQTPAGDRQPASGQQ